MQLHSLRMFATNDYLGLSTHIRVRQAAAEAAMEYGSGKVGCGQWSSARAAPVATGLARQGSRWGLAF